MNPVMFVLGVLSIGVGVVTLVWRLHDRSIHETLASSVTAFVGLLAPIVTSIAVGIAFVGVAAMRW